MRKLFAHSLRKAGQVRSISQQRLAELAGLRRTYIGSVDRDESDLSLEVPGQCITGCSAVVATPTRSASENQ
jgi:hypothetical protein